MAAFSLGKLDAICARLKSSQQPASLCHPSSLDLEVERSISCHGKHNREEQTNDRGGSLFETDKPSISALVKEQQSACLSLHNKHMDAQRTDVFEKVKSQTVNGDVVNETVSGDSSIINKHNNSNNNNNNNVTEAKDYNETSSSSHFPTFQTADSHVSSTTDDPVLCNQKVISNQISSIPSASTIPLPHSNSIRTVISEPAALSTLELFVSNGLVSVSGSKKSMCPHIPSLDLPNIPNCDYDIQNTDDRFAARHADSAVTSTGQNHVCACNNVAPESDTAHEDVLPDVVPSSQLLVSSLISSVPSSLLEMTIQNEQKFACYDTVGNSDCTVLEDNAETENKQDHLESNRNIDKIVNCQYPGHSASRDGVQLMGSVNTSPSNLFSTPPAVVIGSSMSETTQDLSQAVKSSHSLSSSVSQKSFGRRQRRKPTKPQRQVPSSSFIDKQTAREILNENPRLVDVFEHNGDKDIISSDVSENPFELTSSYGNSQAIFQKDCLPGLELLSPLDLSLKNTSNHSLVRSGSDQLLFSNISAEEKFTDLKPDSRSTDKDPSEEINSNTHERSLSEEITDKTSHDYDQNQSSVSRMSSRESPTSETSTTESNVLVDFANNTMKELLDIYGFDNCDSKNAATDSMNSFESGRLTGFPAANGVNSDSAGNSTKSGQENSDIKRVISVNTTARISLGKKSCLQKSLNSADFTKYIKRYGTGIDCGEKICQDLGYRDHYHCLDCKQKVFIRKEEMVRHCKWHKKREDSLQHGFMRYSPLDDCGKKYGNCIHNGRQTHYHCVQKGCDKVYVSTSDVQMHANFHRKDSAIIQEGFQRFRATEDCGTTSCSFYGLRTTHFHCRRPHCNFTFKNKADMEKHKSYHQKDEVLSRDGFKKFMKYESCPFTGCRYSKISNHIHCIRQGCPYVLHSTAQLYSHKRKHEKREIENSSQSLQNYRHLQQQKSANESVIKIEMGAQNGVNSTAAVVAASHIKMLPLPQSTFSSGKTVPGISFKTSDVDTLQSLQVENSPTSNMIHSYAARAVPAQGFAEMNPLNLSEKVVDGGVTRPLKLSRNEVNSGEVTLPLLVQPSAEVFSSCPIHVKLEPKSEGQCQEDTHFMDQPEDLSVPGKKTLPEDLSVPAKKTLQAVHLKDESVTNNDFLKSEPELHQKNEVCDDEDDDSDDDDDKDYGQLEEPTLVNTACCGLEEDRPSDLLIIPTPKQNSPFSGEVLIKKEVNFNLLAANDAKSETQQYLLKSPSVVDNPEHGKSQQETLNDQHLLAQSKLLPETSPVAVRTTEGRVLRIRLPQKQSPERRDKDDVWKRYIVRYTANDACFSRCACLYKDHYHCRLEGCQVVFRSKDGVRNHARYHELQDSITPLVYLYFKSSTSCSVADCQYSGKEAHYHCNWTSCAHVIPASSPTFSRLEHYRIHEYASVSLNKNRGSISCAESGVDLDPLKKRRGRPPKYPKYNLPLVPKVHLTEKEILDSTLASMHNKCSQDSKVVNGFRKFSASEYCPDELCVYKGREHFHCGRKYCHVSTDRLDFLNLHAKDFHNNVTILVGYEFFERMVDCRRPDCQNNKVNRHFHCIRPRCDYSFVRHSTMTHHNRKHPTVTSTVLSTPVVKSVSTLGKIVPSQFIPIAPAAATSQAFSTPKASQSFNKTIKSSGTYFPKSGISSFKIGSLASPSVTKSKMLMSASKSPGLSSTSLTPASATPTQLVAVSPVLQSQDGLSLFSPAALLALPHGIVPTAIPFVAHNVQAGILSGIIPVGHLSHHGNTTPLVNISAGQLIAAPQSHVLQQNGVDRNVDLVVHNQTTTAAIPTSAPPATFTSQTKITSPPAASLFQQYPQLQLWGHTATSVNWATLKKQMQYSVNQNCGRPFCKLKKKDHYHCLDCNQAFSDPARLRVHIGKHGFKFKKSKNKTDGVSCQPLNDSLQQQSQLTDCLQQQSQLTDCLQQPSDATALFHKSESRGDAKDVSTQEEALWSSPSQRLRHSFTDLLRKTDLPVTSSIPELSVRKTPTAGHLNSKSITSSSSSSASRQKHITESEDDQVEEDNLTESVDCKDSPPPGLGDSMSGSGESSLDASSSSLTLCSSLLRKFGRKRRASKNIELAIPTTAKVRKVYTGIMEEAGLPEGYQRIACGKDCGHTRCAYRQTVTHFHCLRTDCGYGFSDKSRIIQHHVRHERLDSLMGGEFQQFRASVKCDRDGCEFSEKASHFHCLKCSYSCADSSKVPAHRKYHFKMDIISNQGFIKYSGMANCQTTACSYFRKQTHYHCTFPGCNHAVLGPSQMMPHKLKHAQHQTV